MAGVTGADFAILHNFRSVGFQIVTCGYGHWAGQGELRAPGALRSTVGGDVGRSPRRRGSPSPWAVTQSPRHLGHRDPLSPLRSPDHESRYLGDCSHRVPKRGVLSGFLTAVIGMLAPLPCSHSSPAVQLRKEHRCCFVTSGTPGRGGMGQLVGSREGLTWLVPQCHTPVHRNTSFKRS